jgi:D-alanyl-D-alanine carboxypeptidase
VKQLFFFLCLICIFFPFYGYSQNPRLDIAGKSALTMDPDTGEIIFAMNIDKKKYPASTTKLVTALLLAQSMEKGDILYYSADAKAVYPFKLDLPGGSMVKAKDAMDALLLFSGNDIAYMIGENIGGSTDKFTLLMNEYMKTLGLQHTHFVNPSGLHSPEHYTTAYDLSIIARNLYKFPWIMETMGKKESRIVIDHRIIDLKNRNKMLGEKGCIGGKTGWTPDAGRCLVALFNIDQRRMIGIVLDSIYDTRDTTVFADMEKIIDYSYNTEKITIIEAPGIIKRIPVTFRLFPFIGPVVTRDIPLELREEVKVYPRGDQVNISFHFSIPGILHLNTHHPAGVLIVAQREYSSHYHLYPVISSSDILRWDILPFYTAILSCLFILIFISFVILLLKGR